MKKLDKKKLMGFGLSIYVFYTSILIGWQIISFFYFYQNLDKKEIISRVNDWSIFQFYIVGIGIILTLLFLLIKSIQKFKNVKFSRNLNRQVILHSVFIAILLIDIVLHKLDDSPDILRLIIFFIALWILNHWGSFFYHSEFTVWQHPTTYGTFIVASLLNGCALLSLFGFAIFLPDSLSYYILILLLFELFILYARFQFLSKASQELNKIARNFFGSQILLFGIRIIIGIFMPLIFILYSLLIDDGNIEGIGILIIIGTMLERYLFINSNEEIFS